MSCYFNHWSLLQIFHTVPWYSDGSMPWSWSIRTTSSQTSPNSMTTFMIDRGTSLDSSRADRSTSPDWTIYSIIQCIICRGVPILGSGIGIGQSAALGIG